MNKVIYIFAAMVFGIQLVGCTGDPNRPGIFWSEEKAKDRIAQYEQALAQENQKGEALRLERQDLDRKIAAVKKELADLEKKVASSPSGPSAAEAERIRQLEKEIADLEKEAVDLMSVS